MFTSLPVEANRILAQSVASWVILLRALAVVSPPRSSWQVGVALKKAILDPLGRRICSTEIVGDHLADIADAKLGYGVTPIRGPPVLDRRRSDSPAYPGRRAQEVANALTLGRHA